MLFKLHWMSNKALGIILIYIFKDVQALFLRGAGEGAGDNKFFGGFNLRQPKILFWGY